MQDGENDGGPSQFDRNTPPLNTAVKQWPTPVRGDGERRSETYKRGNSTLLGESRQWQTPSKAIADGGQTSRGGDRIGELLLTGQCKQWATPRTDGHDAGKHRGKADSLHSQTKELGKGMLNPDWVETLVGLPVGWTEPEGPSLLDEGTEWLIGGPCLLDPSSTNGNRRA